MRIALFTDSYYPEINGVANSVYILFCELTAMGHEVHVFAPKLKGVPREKNVHRVASMPLVFLRDRRSVVYSPRLLKRINRYRFDVVHTHSEYLMGLLGRMVAKMQRCTCLHTYHTIWEAYTYYVTHGIGDAPARRLAAKFSRVFCNHCDQVIAPTAKVDALLRAYGVRVPIDIIPSGLNIARFAPDQRDAARIAACRAACGIAPDARVILNIGRIAKEKNLEAVLRVMPRVLAEHPDVVFVVIGEGPWIPVLREQAEALGIGARVLFTGPKPWTDIHHYYAMGDVFVSASTSETQGLTYVEAMASGLAVAAQRDPCLDGVLTDGENGLLFDDEDGMHAALTRALSPEGSALGQAAARSVAPYSASTYARSVATLYRKTLLRMTGEEKWRALV